MRGEDPNLMDDKQIREFLEVKSKELRGAERGAQFRNGMPRSQSAARPGSQGGAPQRMTLSSEG